MANVGIQEFLRRDEQPLQHIKSNVGHEPAHSRENRREVSLVAEIDCKECEADKLGHGICRTRYKSQVCRFERKRKNEKEERPANGSGDAFYSNGAGQDKVSW